MYRVIETAGFQHKVTLGDILRVPKMESADGTEVSFSQVLLATEGDDVKVGAPYLEGHSVLTEVLVSGQEDKIKVFKKKRRTGYRRTAGHRQQFTEVCIKSFISPEGTQSAEEKLIGFARNRAAAYKASKLPTPAAPKRIAPVAGKKGE